MKKLLLILCLLVFVSSSAFSIEVIAGLDEAKDLPNINELFRQLDEAIKSNTALSLPSGAIIMWSGAIADIPSGFVLCDGNNSTPDLRDTFVVGAKEDDSGTAKTNITGSLTQSGGNTTHTHTGTTDAGSSGRSASLWEPDSNFAYTVHTHAFTTGNGTHIPTYYALAYIMKT